MLKMLKLGKKTKRYIEIEALIHFALSSMPQDLRLEENAQEILELHFGLDDFEESPNKLFNQTIGEGLVTEGSLILETDGDKTSRKKAVTHLHEDDVKATILQKEPVKSIFKCILQC